MGMGINYKIGNGNGREWELTGWEWEGMGTQKAILGHLYCPDVCKQIGCYLERSVWVIPPHWKMLVI